MRWSNRAQSSSPDIEPTEIPAIRTREALGAEVAESDARLREAERVRILTARKLERLANRTNEAASAEAAANADLEDIIAIDKSFADWLQTKQRSWGIRLLTALGIERETLYGAWKHLRASLEGAHPVRLEDLRDLHNCFVRRVLWSALLSILGVSIIAGVLATLRDESWVRPWFSAVLGVIVFAIAVLMSLTSYHRSISQRRMALRIEMDRIEQAGRASLHLRGERARIESLHDQVPDFLKLLSEIIHRPWVVSPALPGLSRVPRPDLNRLPGHIRLAEPVIDIKDAYGAGLIREAVRLELRPGWRSEAFTRLLRLAELRISQIPGSLDTAVIDRDAVQRHVLLEMLLMRNDDSDRSAYLHPQKRLAAEKIRQIGEGFGTALLGDDDESRLTCFPRVQELTLDAIKEVDVRVDQLQDPAAIPELDWNGYLAELLGVQPDLSWYDLAGEMRSWIHTHVLDDELRALCVGPARLVGPAMAENKATRFQPLVASAFLPVELVVRLDQRTLPGPEGVALFRDSGKWPTDSGVESASVDLNAAKGEAPPDRLNY